MWCYWVMLWLLWRSIWAQVGIAAEGRLRFLHKDAEMWGSPVAFSGVIISLRHSSYNPKRLYIHDLTNILHNHFCNQPVQLFYGNNGTVSGHLTLIIIFLIPQRVHDIASSCSPECLVIAVKWRDGRNSLPRHKQGLREKNVGIKPLD